MKKSICLTFGMLLLLFNSVKAGDPYWWEDYNVTNSQESNDNALASIGQLKHVVDRTINYLEDALADNGGAGDEVRALRSQSWFTSTTNDKIVPTIGQLKYVFAPIYDRLREAYPPDFIFRASDTRAIDATWNTRWMVDSSPFYTHQVLSNAEILPKTPLEGSSPLSGVYTAVSHYPWTEQLEDDEDAGLVTLGQLKFVCSFETPASFDSGTRTITEYTPNKEMEVYIPSNIQAEESLPLYIHITGDSDSGGNTRARLPDWASQGQNRAYTMLIESNGTNTTVMEGLIDSFIEEHQVDTNRIYFSGFSRGGAILFDLLHKRPDLITVAWIIDSGEPSRFSSSTHPLRNIGSNWRSSDATEQQTAFARSIAQHNITIILSIAEVEDNGNVITPSQGLQYYNLFYDNDVSIFYSGAPWGHGASVNFVAHDRRYHRFISNITKNN